MADWSRTGEQAWAGLQGIEAVDYRCGYCGHEVAPDKGWQTASHAGVIRVCSFCNGPSFFSYVGTTTQWPGPLVGEAVKSVPDEVAAIYDEARHSVTVNAFTGCMMLCRKILMHTAVEKGAADNLTFQQCAQYLVSEHYVPRGAEVWLDYIRKRGNEANHEIVTMTLADAKGLLFFTEELLRAVYELPAAVPTI